MTLTIPLQVPIVTKNMTEQLTVSVGETRTTRKSQSAAAGGGEAASSKGKKRTRNDTATAAAKAAAVAVLGPTAAKQDKSRGDEEDGPVKSPKTPRRMELDGLDEAAVETLGALSKAS